MSTLARVELGSGFLTVEWGDGSASRFHYLWLRDNDPSSRHATTRHRLVETSSIPPDVRPSSGFVDESGLHLTWADDGHVSTYEAEWLAANDYSSGTRRVGSTVTLWDASMRSQIPDASYEAVLEDLSARRDFLRGFMRFGVGLLRGVQTVPGTVLDVAAQFGEVRTTSWGRLFDVVSMVDANSVAYTNLGLVAHTDEAYRDPVPTVQLQHFLVADATGGESTLADGFRIAADIRRDDPAAFELLASTVLHFHFADATSEHVNDKPVIELDPDGVVRCIRFSNHSAAPFLLPFDAMKPYYRAYQLFGAMRESMTYQLTIPMAAGDLYMIDNRRVLHGRTPFSGNGARHLQSCYIERDELVSRLTVASRSRKNEPTGSI